MRAVISFSLIENRRLTLYPGLCHEAGPSEEIEIMQNNIENRPDIGPIKMF